MKSDSSMSGQAIAKHVQTNDEKLRISFKKICEFCGRYNAMKKAISANSLDGLEFAELLRRFSIYLSKLVPHHDSDSITVLTSKAKPSMPRVPWVAFAKRGKFVATSISVGVCFGRAGNGAVVGLMQPSSSGLIAGLEPKIRTLDGGCVIDVNGNNPGTMYNDRFINPVEFLESNFDIDRLAGHLHESLELLRGLN